MAKKKHNVEERHMSPAMSIVTFGETGVKGFVNFLRTQGVVGLAVGLVLGSTATVLAKSLIDNIIMPPIGVLLGSGDGLRGLSLSLGTAADGQSATLDYGIFLNDLLNFIIVAFMVYLVFHLLGLSKLDVKKTDSSI